VNKSKIWNNPLSSRRWVIHIMVESKIELIIKMLDVLKEVANMKVILNQLMKNESFFQNTKLKK
jgi:hypothetical protein